MTSRLFHTVVGVGLALGAMSMGCAAEQTPDVATDTAQVTSYGPTEPVTTPPVTADRFCEVPWPTTKGSRPPTPAEAEACSDPKDACGEYPTSTEGWMDSCVKTFTPGDPTTCGFLDEYLLFCKDTGTSSEWACPAGTIRATECVWETGEKRPEARR